MAECMFCKKQTTLYNNSRQIGITCVGDMLYISYYDIVGEILSGNQVPEKILLKQKIKYCPFCGCFVQEIKTGIEEKEEEEKECNHNWVQTDYDWTGGMSHYKCTLCGEVRLM